MTRSLLTLGLIVAAVVAWGAVTHMQADTPPATSQPDASVTWLDKLDAAQKESKSTGKPILVDFTGSDWCIWCKRLKAEVFDTAEFKSWASNRVVLLEVDFPRAPQPDQVKKANAALMKQYAVRGFPTIVFTDAAGKELGRSGYMRGGPGNWIAAADKMLPAPTTQPATQPDAGTK